MACHRETHEEDFQSCISGLQRQGLWGGCLGLDCPRCLRGAARGKEEVCLRVLVLLRVGVSCDSHVLVSCHDPLLFVALQVEELPFTWNV